MVVPLDLELPVAKLVKPTWSETGWCGSMVRAAEEESITQMESQTEGYSETKSYGLRKSRKLLRKGELVGQPRRECRRGLLVNGGFRLRERYIQWTANDPDRQLVWAVDRRDDRRYEFNVEQREGKRQQHDDGAQCRDRVRHEFDACCDERGNHKRGLFLRPASRNVGREGNNRRYLKGAQQPRSI